MEQNTQKSQNNAHSSGNGEVLPDINLTQIPEEMHTPLERENLTNSQEPTAPLSPLKKKEKKNMSTLGEISQPLVSPLPDVKISMTHKDMQNTSLFITNMNPYRGLDNFSKIHKLNEQINILLDDLDERVDTVIERHEAEYLFAYRNHMATIKKEMSDLKKQVEEHENLKDNKDSIVGLENQVNWLREECLGLYKIIGQKKEDIQGKDRRIRSLQNENRLLESQIKELVTKNKLMEVKQPVFKLSPDKRQSTNLEVQSSFLTNQQSTSLHTSPLRSNQNNISINKVGQEDQLIGSGQVRTARLQLSPQKKSTKPIQISTTPISLQTKNIQSPLSKDNASKCVPVFDDSKTDYSKTIFSFVKKYMEGLLTIEQLVHDISEFFSNISERRIKLYKQVKEKLEKTIKEKLNFCSTRSELETFFLECVETARKQIHARRKGQIQGGLFQKACETSTHKSKQEYVQSEEHSDDYGLFRSEDKLKLLETLLSRNDLVAFLHQKIFPSNLHTVQQRMDMDSKNVSLFGEEEDQVEVTLVNKFKEKLDNNKFVRDEKSAPHSSKKTKLPSLFEPGNQQYSFSENPMSIQNQQKDSKIFDSSFDIATNLQMTNKQAQLFNLITQKRQNNKRKAFKGINVGLITSDLLSYNKHKNRFFQDKSKSSPLDVGLDQANYPFSIKQLSKVV